jgi:N4-gp56 family major capsid protein
MADTNYGVNHPLAVKKWSSELMSEALKKTYVLQFMGKGKDSLVTIKNDLTTSDGGDRIRVGIRSQLRGAGIQGDGTLEGNEEALETFYQDVFIDQLRHAVRSGGKMSEQRVPFSVRDEAREGLADWWADRIDTWFFNQIAGNTGATDARYYGFNATVSPDPDHVSYGNSGVTGTAIDTVEASSISNTTICKMNLTFIETAVEKAKLAKNALRPIKSGGKDYYVMFLHPFQVTSLRTNTATGQWQDIQKSLIQGGDGESNPVFTGALGVYNGVILHESVRVPVSKNSSSVYRAILCGAQAASIAFGRGYGKNTFTWKEELFDYENKLGVGAGCQAGMVKTRFDNSDYGTVVCPTWATAST